MEDEPSRKRPRTAASAKSAAALSAATATIDGGGDTLPQAESDRARAAQLRRDYYNASSLAAAPSAPSSSLVPSPPSTLPTLQNRRITALNDLLRLSAAHDKVYVLSSDEILQELVLLAAHDCLGWPTDTPLPGSATKTREGPATTAGTYKDTQPAFSSKRCWVEPPTPQAAAWACHWKMQLGTDRCSISDTAMQQLEAVLVVLRNLSFASSNARLLAYSPSVLHLLVGCLYEGTDQSYGTDDASASSSAALLSHSAIHALLNLAPHLDVSGQRLCSDRLFYPPPCAGAGAPLPNAEAPQVPDPSGFGLAVGGHWGFGGLWLAKRLDSKEDTLNDVSPEFVLSLSSDYLTAVWSIFPALHHLLTQPKPPPRPVVLLALDLLQEFINQARTGMVGQVHSHDVDEGSDKGSSFTSIPSIRQILVHMPDSLLDRLVDWLYVPRLGPDALEYVDPTQNVVTRVTTLKLLMGYDATVDTDIRDRVLEVLVPLMELDSPRMAARLGCVTRPDGSTGGIRWKLFDSALPILTTGAGRSEAGGLALQLLRELHAAPENRLGLEYVKPRLVELASRDARASNLLWNYLTPRPGDEEEEEEEEEDDDEGPANSSDSERLSSSAVGA